MDWLRARRCRSMIAESRRSAEALHGSASHVRHPHEWRPTAVRVEAVGDAMRLVERVAVDSGEQRAGEQAPVDLARRVRREFAADRLDIGVDRVGDLDHVVGEVSDVGAVGLAHDVRNAQRREAGEHRMMGGVESPEWVDHGRLRSYGDHLTCLAVCCQYLLLSKVIGAGYPILAARKLAQYAMAYG